VVVATLAAVVAQEIRGAENTWEYSVQVSAIVQSVPPQIKLVWPQDVNGTPIRYTVFRKSKDSDAWGAGTELPGSPIEYVDSNLTVGGEYEYQIVKETAAYPGYGYIFAGIEAPMIDDRGKLVLIVDNTHAAALASELGLLQRDLVGDGWTVVRHDVGRDSSPVEVKALIRAEYVADPDRVRSVLLFGRVPVAYSGNLAADDHFEEMGAWPADLYYGEMTSAWTDTTVSNTTALTSRRWNVPGDGKLDPSEIPSTVELAVGRVDLANMPGRKEWMGPATFPSELELLRNYLNKNHEFRHARLSIQRRGLVYDGAGAREGAAFAVSGWRNFAPFFGASNIRVAADNEFLPILTNSSYLWSYANGGADSYNIAYLGGTGNFNGGRTPDFVELDVQTVFVMLFGSHLGDWDAEDNIMRSILATPTYGLTCSFGGAPHWYLHHMGLGETIGYSTRLTQNNRPGGLYRNEYNQAAGMVHVALMGDPTLRLHPVGPPSALIATIVGGVTHLQWAPSSDSVAGYHVYRASSASGPFTRITPVPVTGSTYSDSFDGGGTYMVRAVKLEISGSGSYFNPSQGVFATATAAVTMDSDGDGMTDAAEGIAGTDPEDPGSVLRILSAAADESGALRLEWSSVPGKTYRVVRSAGVTSAEWVEAVGNIPSAGSVTAWAMPGPYEFPFYRVEVVP
jgi:hypothetical protein